MTSEHFFANSQFQRLADATERGHDSMMESAQRPMSEIRNSDRVDHDSTVAVSPFMQTALMPPFLTQRSITIVLPAWNEEEIIAETVASVIAALHDMTPDFEVIIVDDGSVDRTGAIADDLAAANTTIRVVHNRPNQGYGGALAAGFQAAEKELIFFMDADGQFDIHDLARLIGALEQDAGAVVLGYRAHRQDPPLRLLNAWAWKQLVSALFQFRVRDIDCAFKLMPTALVSRADVQSRGAMINTEMLAKFARMDVSIAQVPVQHFPRQKGKATGANLKVILRAFGELFRLYGRVRHWVPAAEPALVAVPVLSGDQAAYDGVTSHEYEGRREG